MQPLFQLQNPQLRAQGCVLGSEAHDAALTEALHALTRAMETPRPQTSGEGAYSREAHRIGRRAMLLARRGDA